MPDSRLSPVAGGPTPAGSGGIPNSSTATATLNADTAPAVERAPAGSEGADASRVAMSPLRRMPIVADPLDPKSGIPADALRDDRVQAVTKLHAALELVKSQFKQIQDVASSLVVPHRLFITLLQPDGTTPAERVQVTLDLRQLGLDGVSRAAVTDEQGSLALTLPRGRPVPKDESLSLLVQGADSSQTVRLPVSRISPSGLVAGVVLSQPARPLPASILARLEELVSPLSGTLPPAASETEGTPKIHRLGEKGEHEIVYRRNASVDRFPYGVFVRLVEPSTSVKVSRFKLKKDNNRFIPLTNWWRKPVIGLETEFVDRVPVEQPISVDGFRDNVVGVDGGEIVASPETVPMAGTLGLGYVVHMAQLWTPRDMALGDLVYSLPLAPGEQQRVAIFERRDTLSVTEYESLDIEERRAQIEQADASTLATFASAFHEAMTGRSEFHTFSANEGWGAFLGLFGGSGGSAASAGGASSSIEGQRNYVSSASEATHSAVVRQAAARRNASRVGMRLATGTESQNVTTKVITNHNHTRALTLQYWEVQRLFDVTTDIEGVTLVCLVPLEVVRFLLPGQRLTLTRETMPDTTQEVLARYSQLLKHADVIAPFVPPRLRNGVTLLRQFAANPSATVETAGALAEQVIKLSVTGTFLPFEHVSVSAVTRQGVRLGPARMTGEVQAVPVAADPASAKSAFSSKPALMDYLRARRAGPPSAGGWVEATLEASLVIPPEFGRDDIVGFELNRRFETLTYGLVSEEVRLFGVLGLPFPSEWAQKLLVSSTIQVSPQELEQALGGPRLASFSASLFRPGAVVDPLYLPSQFYVNQGLGHAEQPWDPMPIPAVQMPPELRYAQLLQIEQTLQHVVRNTIYYSKVVWQSLSAEERAIMLEQFTIGVPSEGIPDKTQDIPLLNCVENRVLGYYGNSMIMPFIIPASIVGEKGMSSADAQKALTAFHKQCFDPPVARIALPTHGVLGEAVLGYSPSAEKIDLTRFWNWTDSPGDAATQISEVTLATSQPSLVAGAQAPATLGTTGPLINNFNAGGVPAPQTGALQALIAAGAAQKDFSTELTNATQLAGIMKDTTAAATSARKDTVAMVKDLNAQAIATAGNILGGMYAGNPTAGSSAASAVYGKGGENATGAATGKAGSEGGGGGADAGGGH